MIDKPTKRKNALGAVNDAELAISAAGQRLAKAERALDDFLESIKKEQNALKSEIGTAKKALADAHASYREARARLLKMLPEEGGEIGAPEPEQDKTSLDHEHAAL